MTPMELALHRAGTKRFIDSDKTVLTLIPSGMSEVAGTKIFSDQPPRPAQDFKVIWPGADSGGKVATYESETARFDFILVGNYDATVAIGDHWSEGTQHYQIEWIAPYNEYEVKAGGNSHGAAPSHG